MAVHIRKKIECNGCGACCQKCPVGCITMRADAAGFLYPAVDESKCIGCGVCEKVCPQLSCDSRHNSAAPQTYAAWSAEADKRMISTSGGLFYELGKKIIADGGKVFGAKYETEQCLVEHAAAKNEKELRKLLQSKYVQSNTKKVFSEIQTLLKNNELVLFCGTPCQVAALHCFLGKEYENLYMIDFICRGVNSPKAYRAWLDEIQEDNKSRVTNVWFKYKEYGWKKSPKCTRIDFDNGTNKVFYGRDNLYMTGYLDYNLYIRPSCGHCRFKGVPRLSDITLADFWGVKKELDDDKGTSMVLLNSKKGEKLFDSIKDSIMFEEADYQSILAGNLCFAESVKINYKSELFLRSLDENKFSTQLHKYSKVPFYRRVLGKGKRIVKNVLGIK